MNAPMPQKPAATLQAAEKRALAGENESQDSQLVFQRLYHEHGVGLCSSSPAPEEHRQGPAVGVSPPQRSGKLPSFSDRVDAAVTEKAQKSPQDAPTPKTRNPATSTTPPLLTTPTTSASVPISAPPSARWRPTSSDPRASSPRLSGEKQKAGAHHGLGATGDRGALVVNGHAPTVKAGRKRKMAATDDLMSESPTQSNEGRSYEQYRESSDRGFPSPRQPSKDPELRTQPLDHSQLSSSHERRTLYEGDTGAVAFDWKPHADARDTVQRHDGDHGRDEDGDLRAPELPVQTSQPDLDASARRGYYNIPAPGHAPETPILPPRLFQTDATQGTVMAPSQLFMQTQYTSGVKKVASPTSSRPSPNLLIQDDATPSNLSSPLKNHGLRTSPTQPLTTSPGFPAPASSPKATDQDDTIPGSPSIKHSRHRARPEPIDDYTPIRNSPNPSASAFAEAEIDEASDLDSDRSQRRRRLARQRQEQATRSLDNISITRREKDEVEVPSTGRRRSTALSASAAYSKTTDPRVVQSCSKIGSTKRAEVQETVADSQEVGIKDEDTLRLVSTGVANRAADNAAYSSANADTELPGEPQRSNDTAASKETIPETSPAREKRALISVTPSLQESDGHGPVPSSFQVSQTERPESNNTKAIASSPPMPPLMAASSQVSRRSTRLRDARTPLVSPSVLTDHPAPTSSSLTSLSTTPTLSSSVTRGDPIVEEAEPEKSTGSSPTALKYLRRKPAKLRTYSPRIRGADRTSRSTRQWSVSTDELAASTPTSATDDRRQSRSFARKSVPEHPPNGNGILRGMTFATSFQVTQTKSANKRLVNKKSVEDMILKAGGRIIQDGFHELFEDNPIESSSLTMKHGDDGFVALITDVHSRKPKYMQALALGLPCLSWKWVSACVSSKELVDWSPYLLCAGHSQVLGAVRSRSMSPYDAGSAKAAETITRRPRLLSNKKVLLVMKKARREEEKRMPYVFLAQALGASLVRVTSLDEARSLLLEKQDTDDPFDSVYVEGHLVDTEGILFGTNQAQGISKKRKRQSVTTSTEVRAPKRVKTLTDELVVQSLILGRLVEQDEIQDDPV